MGPFLVPSAVVPVVYSGVPDPQSPSRVLFAKKELYIKFKCIYQLHNDYNISNIMQKYARFVSISHLRAPLWLNFVLLFLYPLWSCGVFLGEAGGEGSGLAGLSNTLTWFVSADSITAMGFVLDPSTGVKGLRGELLSCRSRGAATTQSCRRLTPPT